MNTELFKKIDDIISVRPTEFDMDSWENGDGCGTTRCAAGWAINLTTNQPLYDSNNNLHQSVYDLAARLGVDADFQQLGAKLLGLTTYESSLFYVDGDRAARFIKLAGQGKHYEARAALDY